MRGCIGRLRAKTAVVTGAGSGIGRAMSLALARKGFTVGVSDAAAGSETPPQASDQGGGNIVNVASAAGIICLPEMAPYNMTKAGIIGLTETLRTELAPNHIGVTVACPLFFDTNLDKATSYTEEFQHEFHLSASKNARPLIMWMARHGMC